MSLQQQSEQTPASDRLNIGSGEDYREAWHNVDYNDRYDPDELVDLSEPWPTAWTDAFGHILASHVFEHLPDLDHAFTEAARCLRPGGTLEVRVPFGINARTDQTHEHVWTWDSGLQFAQNWKEFNNGYQFDPTVPFDLEEREVTYFTGHGPGKYLKSMFWWYWERTDCIWISDAPFCSGEFTFRYRRRGDRE